MSTPKVKSITRRVEGKTWSGNSTGQMSADSLSWEIVSDGDPWSVEEATKISLEMSCEMRRCLFMDEAVVKGDSATSKHSVILKNYETLLNTLSDSKRSVKVQASFADSNDTLLASKSEKDSKVVGDIPS